MQEVAGEAAQLGRRGDEQPPVCMLHPQSTVRSSWDLIIFVFLLYVMISVPVRAAFDEASRAGGGLGRDRAHPHRHRAQFFFNTFYVELVMDCVFLIDIVLVRTVVSLAPPPRVSPVAQPRLSAVLTTPTTHS